MHYIIKAKNSPDYWSRDSGWVRNMENADVFTEYQYERFYISSDGKWVKVIIKEL